MASATQRKMFVNLAVEELDRSVEFFTKLGFTFDPRFTDEQATCMVVSDEAFVMLLVEDRFKDFTQKKLCDATTHTEAIIALSAESREEVDQLVHKALTAGGKASNEPVDHGFMYESSFQDPDGHMWEVIWMDPSALEQQEEPQKAEASAATS
jgi:predicted lactoylglutathione lyase